MDGYARSALELLANASSRFDESAAVYQIADTYLTIADRFVAAGRLNDARTSWQSALNQFRSLQSSESEESRLSKFQSQYGAALGNLAVLARLDGDYASCRKLGSEAVHCQKKALQIKPVDEAARDFLRLHYGELALALSALGECEPLAALAEQRIIDFPDEVAEYCEAATCLADCVEQEGANDGSQSRNDEQLINGYVRRALEILREATELCDSEQTTLLVIDVYIEVGDLLKEVDRIADARMAWSAAQLQLSQIVESAKSDDPQIICNRRAAVRDRLASESQSGSPDD